MSDDSFADEIGQKVDAICLASKHLCGINGRGMHECAAFKLDQPSNAEQTIYCFSFYGPKKISKDLAAEVYACLQAFSFTGNPSLLEREARRFQRRGKAQKLLFDIEPIPSGSGKPPLQVLFVQEPKEGGEWEGMFFVSFQHSQDTLRNLDKVFNLVLAKAGAVRIMQAFAEMAVVINGLARPDEALGILDAVRHDVVGQLSDVSLRKTL